MFFIEPVDEQEIVNIVRNFKNKFSEVQFTDCNDLNMHILKKTVSHFVKPFTYICNKSFENGVFPGGMKSVKVIPLYKSGERNSFNNYRPVSLLPPFSKF